MAKRPVNKRYGYDNRRYRRNRQTVLRRDGYRCQWCGKDLHGADATVDHLVPISSGEIHNDIDNLIAACRSCNSSRGNRGQPNKKRNRAVFLPPGTPSPEDRAFSLPKIPLWVLPSPKKGGTNDANRSNP